MRSPAAASSHSDGRRASPSATTSGHMNRAAAMARRDFDVTIMARAEIKARVNALIQQRERALLASAVSDRQKVLEKLRRWTDGTEEATPVQVRAAELLGKTQGMFRDVHEDGTRQSSEALASELETLLANLSGGGDPDAGPDPDVDVGEVPDIRH